MVITYIISSMDIGQSDKVYFYLRLYHYQLKIHAKKALKNLIQTGQ